LQPLQFPPKVTFYSIYRSYSSFQPLSRFPVDVHLSHVNLSLENYRSTRDRSTCTTPGSCLEVRFFEIASASQGLTCARGIGSAGGLSDGAAAIWHSLRNGLRSTALVSNVCRPPPVRQRMFAESCLQILQIGVNACRLSNGQSRSWIGLRVAVDSRSVPNNERASYK
jgi:hypothetical protein